MRLSLAKLIGLALAFTIAGEALFIYVSIGTAPRQPTITRLARPTTPAPPAPAALPVLKPVELPRVVAPAPSLPDVVPNVIYPDAPPGARKPGSGVAGTGFFVSSDGSLVTAAHVVNGCERIHVVSSMVRPSTAETLAIDQTEDIALLRVAHVTPPATLSVGRPAGTTARLFVLGYPGSGNPLTPTETWGLLENAKMVPAPAKFVDPDRTIWAEAPVVAHGFSGGPMLDPRSGVVVGIVRGMVNSKQLHAERASIPAEGLVIGPGSSPVIALLRQQGTVADAITLTGTDALEAARRATVHVLCIY